ncbi:MAG: pyridoxine 5'-phosphate synthase [bacterium]
MSSLVVNVDTVSFFREMRGRNEPDPAQVTVLAEMAGADGISVQLSARRRAMHERDLYVLASVVKTRLMIEMPPADVLIEKALEIKPSMVTLVADQATGSIDPSTINLNDGEFDYSGLIARLGGASVGVSFFIEPEPDLIRKAAKAGAAAVLINCATYANARTLQDAQHELDRIDRTVVAAGKAGLSVACGRGLNHRNLKPLVELGAVDDFVIGYSICARALLIGYERAVREIVSAI